MSADRIEELEREIAALRAQVERLSQSPPSWRERERSSRREVLRRGALLAGTGAAIAAFARPSTAAALDGQPLIIGADNESAGSTSLWSTSAGQAAFIGDSTGAGPATGVTGLASSPDGAGVYGLASSATGVTSGVNGEAASPNGVGVFGLSTGGGVGVQGYSNAPSGGIGLSGRSDGQNGVGVEGLGPVSGPGRGMYGTAGGDTGVGVVGFVTGTQATGVEGSASSPTGSPIGVSGGSVAPNGWGVVGSHMAATPGSGAGVLGRSNTPGGAAISALSSVTTGDATGVSAVTNSPDATAIVAAAMNGGVGLTASGARAAIRLARSGPPPLGTAFARQGGELYVDDAGELWFCRVGGTPGTWVRLSAVDGGVSRPSLVPIEPFRAYDSRAQGAGGPQRAGEQRSPSVAATVDLDTGLTSPGSPVPAGSLAVTYNVTIVGTVGAGFLAVAPGGATRARTSTINWTQSGATMANASFVGLSTDQRVTVFVGGAPGAATDYIIDVTGYLR